MFSTPMWSSDKDWFGIPSLDKDWLINPSFSIEVSDDFG